MPDFTCRQCGRSFELSETVLERYPGWTPKLCIRCKRPTSEPSSRAAGGGSFPAGQSARGAFARGGAGMSTVTRASSGAPARGFASLREENLTTAEVLRKYQGGPKSGIFTDGAAEPNPGPGGWGVVHVEDDRIVREEWGHEPSTTSNRMELMALMAACRIVPAGTRAVVYSDSRLCVSTFTEWAPAWEARGWKRKTGEIKNLDLVQELYRTLKQRPELRLEWIKAHAGNRWNEYADSLATAYRRRVR